MPETGGRRVTTRWHEATAARSSSAADSEREKEGGGGGSVSRGGPTSGLGRTIGPAGAARPRRVSAQWQLRV
jgi:hypothetical protein